MIGAGAFGYGVGSPMMPLELERAASGGNGGGGGIETLWDLHPAGFSWKGDEGLNATPSVANLADGANWDRILDRGEVHHVPIVTVKKATNQQGV